MKQVLKIFQLISLICVYAIIFGCSDIVVVNPDPMIGPNNPKNGFLALSGVCQGRDAFILYYIPPRFSYLNPFTTVITCQKGSQHFMVSLPAGRYQVDGLTFNKYLWAQHFTPIPFDIEPGQVAYIGRFYITYIPAQTSRSFGYAFWYGRDFGKVGYSIRDDSDEDMIWFLQKYKNIDKSRYNNQVVPSEGNCNC